MSLSVPLGYSFALTCIPNPTTSQSGSSPEPVRLQGVPSVPSLPSFLSSPSPVLGSLETHRSFVLGWLQHPPPLIFPSSCLSRP